MYSTGIHFTAIFSSTLSLIIKLEIYSPSPLSYFTYLSVEVEGNNVRDNERALQPHSHQTPSLLGLSLHLLFSLSRYSFLGFLHSNITSSRSPSPTIQSQLRQAFNTSSFTSLTSQDLPLSEITSLIVYSPYPQL